MKKQHQPNGNAKFSRRRRFAFAYGDVRGQMLLDGYSQSWPIQTECYVHTVIESCKRILCRNTVAYAQKTILCCILSSSEVKNLSDVW